MNTQNYTQKTLEAVQAAQSLATRHGNQQIEQSHLLLALLTAENGLVPQLLANMGPTVPPCRPRWKSSPRSPARAGRWGRSTSPRGWTGP